MALIYVVIIGVIIASSQEPFGGPRDLYPAAAVNGLALTLVFCVAVTALLTWWTVRAFGRGSTRRFARRAHRANLLLRAAIVGAYALLVYGFDWPVIAGMYVPVVRSLVMLAPFLLMLLVGLVLPYRVERVVRGAAWSFPAYAWFQFRHYVVIVLLPWLLLAAAHELVQAWYDTLRLYVPYADWCASAGFAALLYILAPVGLRFIWQTEPLPPGELRSRLEGVCGAAKLRCRNVLVWRMGPSRIANACIAGVVPWTRYVFLTDALLAQLTPAEIEAVFAHEAGHVKHRHMLYYLWLAICFLLVYEVVNDVAGDLLGRSDVVEIATLLATAFVYWFGFFGFVSRRMEQQADLYAARLMGGPEAFASALEQISLANGMDPTARSWRHFSIARRIGFLLSVAADPDVERRFQCSLRYLRFATVAVALLCGMYIVLLEDLSW